MRFSCLPVSYFSQVNAGGMTLPDWGREAASLGFDGFDISSIFIMRHTPVYLRKFREFLDESPIPLVMMTTYPDFTHPDAIQRRREIDYYISEIAVCSQLGIPYLRLLGGQAWPGVSVEQGLEYMAEAFSRISNAARSYNVTLVYENHAKPADWDYLDFGFPLSVFRRIIPLINGRTIRLNFDTANATAAGADSLRLLREVYPLVETLHLSDTASDTALVPAQIGTGLTPNREILEWLRTQQFGGWICIEEASGQGQNGIRAALDFVRPFR